MKSISNHLDLAKQILLILWLFLLMSVPLFSQSVVCGRIIGNQGEVLFGTTIANIGAGDGTASDSTGRFSIGANPGEVPRFSYLGYMDQEIVFASETDLIIVLTASIENLNELIMVGNGTISHNHTMGISGGSDSCRILMNND